MATLEFLQKRIEGKQAEVNKLEKKLERILKAQATNWEVNPYYYEEYDIKRTTKELDNAKQALNDYQIKLQVELDKASSRNIPAIIEFLERWKERCEEYYKDGLEEYFAELKEISRLRDIAYSYPYYTKEHDEAYAVLREADKAFEKKCRGYFKKWEIVRNGRRYTGTTKEREGEYEYLKPFMGRGNMAQTMEYVKKVLKEEAERKYDDIVNRTCEKIGTITNATRLKVGAKGDLNGIIEGEKGSVTVETIGAGGYNIQCYHFRTLIHKVH